MARCMPFSKDRKLVAFFKQTIIVATGISKAIKVDKPLDDSKRTFIHT
jgi:hypothetical protein